ncbi:hypothetical protein B484DRAFT_269957 [Ochromonadaceae sp. CCMP2298]|nr:hypothetical protein B484DRAFT_269957 [Ochromonadaceae sp. CCMP2298]
MHLCRGGTSVSEWEDTLLGRVKDYYTAATASTASTASTSSTASVSAQEDCKDSSEGDGGGYGDEVGERDKGGEGTVYFRRNGRPLPPQRKYMEVVYGMTPMYGCSFFRCTQHSSRALPDTVQLGVHRLGLGIFDRNKKLVRMFHIEDIFRWGFKPCQMFYFEIAEDQELGTSSLEFDTVEGKVCVCMCV